MIAGAGRQAHRDCSNSNLLFAQISLPGGRQRAGEYDDETGELLCCNRCANSQHCVLAVVREVREEVGLDLSDS